MPGDMYLGALSHQQIEYSSQMKEAQKREEKKVSKTKHNIKKIQELCMLTINRKRKRNLREKVQRVED